MNYSKHHAHDFALFGIIFDCVSKLSNRKTIDVECEVLESKPLNLNMQPSEIHIRQELLKCKEVVKSGTSDEKSNAKARIKEIESALGIDKKLEKASIATDEQE
jgi:hypothetical protein